MAHTASFKRVGPPYHVYDTSMWPLSDVQSNVQGVITRSVQGVLRRSEARSRYV